ncbi:MAG: calcium/sodium antiporter [Hespellia sp.]|nr:calcium/sodium antiporter [Hespellia sp.]
MISYVLLIVGFFLLIKGADFFVDGCSSVAKLLRVPTVIIGLTVVAFGTSMPEASVSINAALQGKNDLAVSNVIGSNLFNLLVVLGACAVTRPMKAKWSVIKKEFPFSILITIVLFLAMTGFQFSGIMSGDGTFVLTRIGGVILLALFAVFLASTVMDALKHRANIAQSGEPEEEYEVLPPLRTAIYIIGGLVGIVAGGNFVVDSATDIAKQFGLSQTFIGLTIVALGTSLPELVTSLVAAKKGENDLALGNVVGSNVFNILLILGASATITPITVDVLAVYDTMILIVASLLVYVCAISRKGFSKLEGAMFLLFYAGFFAYILTR